MLDVTLLPTVNAVLNGAAAILLVAGYTCIRTGHRVAHHRVMLAAFGTSVLFLACYVTYHAIHLHTPFRGQGPVRIAYFILLTSHVVLAIAVVPLALVLLVWGWRGQFARHKRLARWALPIWLYVSVTGVLVYLMLYHWFAGPART
ncbi:MAG TPA: DUF420 domain-containing protein [bacterium]|nr:DUF420 domain-containing protein [bacterium]